MREVFNPVVFFLLLMKGSLFSTSGTGNLPILHDDLIARGWATERNFAEALAIGQVTPGPTGLWVISFACLVDGVRGAIFATIAVVLPPLLVVGVDRLYRRVSHHPAVEGFVHGLGVAVVGTFLVVLAGILGVDGVDARAIGIAVVAAALGLTRRVPVLVVLGLAAVAGIALF